MQNRSRRRPWLITAAFVCFGLALGSLFATREEDAARLVGSYAGGMLLAGIGVALLLIAIVRR